MSLSCDIDDISSHHNSSCDVPISEGPVNLQWGQIMKTINDDPHAFYDLGGFSFLGGSGDVCASPFWLDEPH